MSGISSVKEALLDDIDTIDIIPLSSVLKTLKLFALPVITLVWVTRPDIVFTVLFLLISVMFSLHRRLKYTAYILHRQRLEERLENDEEEDYAQLETDIAFHQIVENYNGAGKEKNNIFYKIWDSL